MSRFVPLLGQRLFYARNTSNFHRCQISVGIAVAAAEAVTKMFRLAATADLHCKISSAGAFKEIFARLAEDVDALALCGDLVDYGLPAEAEFLLEELNPVLRKKIPTLAGVRQS